MGSRSEVLELAVLGQLQAGQAHGYAIRKQLNASMGTFRSLSYGALYPCLKSLESRGFIAAVDTATLPHALATKRTRIVYKLTAAGLEFLNEKLTTVQSDAWEDDNFDVRFSLFAEVDPTTRLRVLQGRHTRMVERREALREHVALARESRDAYTQELHRHALEQVSRDIRWLEDLITVESKNPTTAKPLPPNKKEK